MSIMSFLQIFKLFLAFAVLPDQPPSPEQQQLPDLPELCPPDLSPLSLRQPEHAGRQHAKAAVRLVVHSQLAGLYQDIPLISNTRSLEHPQKRTEARSWTFIGSTRLKLHSPTYARNSTAQRSTRDTTESVQLYIENLIKACFPISPPIGC